MRKRQRAVLKPAELREVIACTDEIERQEAKRLRAMVKLAKLRGRSLRGTDEGIELARRHADFVGRYGSEARATMNGKDG